MIVTAEITVSGQETPSNIHLLQLLYSSGYLIGRQSHQRERESTENIRNRHRASIGLHTRIRNTQPVEGLQHIAIEFAADRASLEEFKDKLQEVRTRAILEQVRIQARVIEERIVREKAPARLSVEEGR